MAAGGLSLVSGILFFTGILASTTVVLAVVVIGAYTAIQITIDTLEDRPVHYLLLINSIVFLAAIISFLIFGIKAGGFSLVQYSAGHIYAYGAVITETCILFALSWAARGRKRLYLVLLGAFICAGSLIVMLIPALQAIAIQGIWFLSGTQPYSLGIQECRPGPLRAPGKIQTSSSSSWRVDSFSWPRI